MSLRLHYKQARFGLATGVTATMLSALKLILIYAEAVLDF